MESICRLCLHKNLTSDMLNIFENISVELESNLAEFLYWTFEVEVCAEDTLTKLICKKCFNVIHHMRTLKKFFQTNQKILREKRCPDDYVVQLGWYNTKEVGTNTNIEPQKNTTVCLNVLEKVLVYPYVKLTKLENSCIVNQYKKLNNTTYRKINPKASKIKPASQATHAVTGLKPTVVKKPLSSIIQKKSVIKNNTEPKGKTKPIFLNETVYDDATIKNEVDNTNFEHLHISVPLSTFNNFPEPYVALEKLENCDFSKTYKKLSDFHYKRVEPTLISEHSETNSSNILHATTAQGSTIEKSERVKTKKMFNRKNKELLKINEVYDVEVCVHCSEIFKSRKSLYCHYYMKHKLPTCRNQLKKSKIPVQLAISNHHTESSVIHNSTQGKIIKAAQVKTKTKRKLVKNCFLKHHLLVSNNISTYLTFFEKCRKKNTKNVKRESKVHITSLPYSDHNYAKTTLKKKKRLN